MSLDPKAVVKPFRKLRQALKNCPVSPLPDDVHDIRTRAAHLEALIHALTLDADPEGRRLGDTITYLRKKAGKVRDMDVLAGLADTLTSEVKDEGLAQLLSQLGEQRIRFARKFCAAIAKKGKKVCRALKQQEDLIGGQFAAVDEGDAEERARKTNARFGARRLSADLAAWPKLDDGNLHAFRLKVKQLIYVLQLGVDPDGALLKALEETKAAIGDWHDWDDLRTMAIEVLDHDRTRGLHKRIDSTVREKLAHALAVSERLKKRLLTTRHRRHRHAKRPVRLKESVTMTAARMGGQANRVRGLAS